MRQSSLHLAVDHHAALAGKIARKNNARLTLGYRRGGFHQKRANGKTSRALVCRIPVLVAGRIIELLAGGVNKHWILSALAVVDLRPCEPEPRRFDFGRGVFDEQDRQAVGRNLIDLRYDHAKAVRINEPRIDPALARLGGQLADVDVAWGEQYLLDAAVDEVAINIGDGKSVIRAQRLDLRDSCVVGAQVPKTNIIEQRGVLQSIDSLLSGSSEGTFSGAPVQAKGNRRSLNMALDVGPLDRDLIRSHIDGANDARQDQFQNKSAAKTAIIRSQRKGRVTFSST